MRPFAYARPATVESAIAAHVAAGPGARYLAGGTTLYDLMKLGVEEPRQLIDLSAVPGLATVRTDGRTLRFGAMALMGDVARTPAVRDGYPVLAESLLKAASQQLRNMATVGGNLLQRTRCAYFRAADADYPCNKRRPGSGCAAIGGLDRGQAVLGTSEACNAVSPGDWPVALMALDATIETAGPAGRRSLRIADLYRQPGAAPEREFALLPAELITAIVVEKAAVGRASTYHKVRDRESYAFALASAAVALRIEDGIVREARIALGGVATVPWRAHAAEEALRGKAWSPELAATVGPLALRDARPGAHNGFKTELGARVVADALVIAAARSRS